MQTTRKIVSPITRLARASQLALLALAACGVDNGQGDSPGLEGELVIHVADYDDHSSSTHYSLITANGREFELLFEEDPQLGPGLKVRVDGAIDDTGGSPRVYVDFINVVDEAGTTSSKYEALVNGAVRPDYRVVTLLIHWGSPDGETVAGMRQKVFTGATSTNEYYKEASWGTQGITGEVYGWFRIPDPGGCNTSQMAADARAAAQAAGVNLGQFQQIQYYFPRYSPCSWSGLGQIGTPTRPARDTWYNGSSGCVVLAHELGHNYGLMHSRSCGTLNASQVCGTQSEYGDVFCVMGGGCWHMNAVQKGMMGWYGGCNMVTVGTDAEFTIAPTELPSNEIQALRIPRGNGRFFYIENRMPLGRFDTRRSGSSTLNTVFDGVLIHEGPEVNPLPSSSSRYPYLFDATPNTSTFNDAALAVGRTYTSPEGISITVVSKSEAGAVVRVRRPNGGSGAAVCGDGSQYGGGGGTPQPPPSACGTGEAAFGGSCYALTGSAQSYDAAQASCENRGAGWALAEIGSASENAFVSSLVGSTEAWLGGNDRAVEGRWVWESGSQFWSGGVNGNPVGGRYVNWLSDEPNDAPTPADCLRMVSGGGWRDSNCSSSYRAVCEAANSGAAAHRLVARHSGKCFDVNNASIADGTNIQQWACNGTGAQSFRLVPQGSYYQLVNTNSGKCARASGTADGANVDQQTCDSHNNKQWTLESVGSGYSRIRNRHANKCAHVQSGGTADGTNVYIWPCSSSTSASSSFRQHWTIETL